MYDFVSVGPIDSKQRSKIGMGNSDEKKTNEIPLALQSLVTQTDKDGNQIIIQPVSVFYFVC